MITILDALMEYRKARAMPSVGDYASILYTRPSCTYDTSYHGGNCEAHGRYYGRDCLTCDTIWRIMIRYYDPEGEHTNEPWDTIDKVFQIVINMFATLGFFCTLGILGYLFEIWK